MGSVLNVKNGVLGLGFLGPWFQGELEFQVRFFVGK